MLDSHLHLISLKLLLYEKLFCFCCQLGKSSCGYGLSDTNVGFAEQSEGLHFKRDMYFIF